MVTVKQLIERLKQFDGDEIVTIDARNYDGSAWADLCVGTKEESIASSTDYFNNGEITLV